MQTENLETLKIHKLTQAQYDRELAAGNIDETALYLTPDEEIDLSGYATKEDLASKADSSHTHDDRYYTETEVDAKVDTKLPLSGGTMTGAVQFNEVDGNSINFDNGIYINKKGGSTLLGSNGQTAWVGMPMAALTFRGSNSRPTYNGSNVALSSDIPTIPGAATTSSAGLMSASDKSKLDGITSSADSVSFTSSLTSGTKVGTITINGSGTDLYAPKYAGRIVQGETLLDSSDDEYIGGECAEIFNDYESNVASGPYSHAEGRGNLASGYYSHAEGAWNLASGYYSHAEGGSTTASGNYSHAEGQRATASGEYSHAEGLETIASGECSHAEGCGTIASGNCSHTEGFWTTASGKYSHAEGYETRANDCQHASGKYNVSTTGPNSYDTQDSSQTDGIFLVGCGTSSATKNAFRISSGGKCFGTTSFGASGADFAELFEWADGNPDSEDRRGLFVTLVGEKIKLANAGDDYIGVISSAQAFIGNSASEDWQGKYLTDVFGAKLSQKVEVPAEIDEKTGEVITPATTTTQYVLNPDYDPEQKYVMRENRKEWGIVGLLGQIVMIDDGTCVVGGRIEPSANGIGTSSTSGYRVMARIDENHVKVLVK